jgi:hypothetical protein
MLLKLIIAQNHIKFFGIIHKLLSKKKDLIRSHFYRNLNFYHQKLRNFTFHLN